MIRGVHLLNCSLQKCLGPWYRSGTVCFGILIFNLNSLCLGKYVNLGISCRLLPARCLLTVAGIHCSRRKPTDAGRTMTSTDAFILKRRTITMDYDCWVFDRMLKVAAQGPNTVYTTVVVLGLASF